MTKDTFHSTRLLKDPLKNNTFVASKEEAEKIFLERNYLGEKEEEKKT